MDTQENTQRRIDASSFRLRKAQDDDVAAMAALSVSAFLDSPMHKAMFPERLRIKPGIQDRVEWNMSRIRKGFGDSRLNYLVVLYSPPDGGDIIVGCAEWLAPGDDAEDEKKKHESGERPKEEKAREMEGRLGGLPAFLDKNAILNANDEITELLDHSKEAFQGKSRHKMWTLNSISVDGDFRGLGIGKMLTRWGMEQAKKDEADIWIISSPLGKPLYERLGFKPVAEGSRMGEPQYVLLKFHQDSP